MTAPDSAISRPIRLRPGAIAWTEVDDYVVALDLEASEYVELNASATFILRLLESGTTETALARELRQRFRIELRRAADDVGRFLEVCRERGWLIE